MKEMNESLNSLRDFICHEKKKYNINSIENFSIPYAFVRFVVDVVYHTRNIVKFINAWMIVFTQIINLRQMVECCLCLSSGRDIQYKMRKLFPTSIESFIFHSFAQHFTFSYYQCQLTFVHVYNVWYNV
jgi:hypothetical protein